MGIIRTQRRGGARGRAIARLGVLALVAGALVAPAGTAHAATVTVANGITTTDLNAVGMSPTSLAQALVGTGVTVSNVSYVGANAQAGAIHVVDPAVVSFNDGVIMSTGNIADIVGPNKSDGITGDMAGPDDADLNALIANTQTVNPITFDRAALEFDFVPNADHVYFTYTFSSDEYLEWVNLFNDVFAFYVNGQNCATVPNGDPVSIDTINSSVNPNLFRDNSYSAPPANPINIESDGLSVEMICSAAVNPGVTNHMKLAIADTSDQILDSVVMIKSGSLSTIKPESCNDGVDNNDDTKVDMEDPECQATTTPPPSGSGGSGIGSGGSGPAFTGNEGQPITLDASALDWTATNDTLTTSWTVHDKANPSITCDITPSGRQPVEAGHKIAVVTAVCPNEGEYVARVDGWDNENKSAFDNDVDFFVHNAPPAVSIDAPTTNTQVGVGDQILVSATVSDPGVADSTTCEIAWGDGTSTAGDLVDGVCTGSATAGGVGTQVISVIATDGAGASAAAAAVVEVVGASVTLSSGTNPSVVGEPVDLTASTIGGSGGSVTFSDGADVIGSAPVVDGAAVLTTSFASVGTHSITATYEPLVGAAVPSESLDQVVQVGATETSLASPSNPSVAGQSIVVWGSVAPVAPAAGTVGGTIELYDGGTLVASRPLSGGMAAFAVKPGVGTHSYTAVYGGSASFAGSTTAAPLLQQVDRAATTTTLTSTVNPTVTGQATTLKVGVAAVAPGTGKPTGTVTLRDGAVTLGTVTLANGVASLGVKLPVGTHRITATYAGSSSYLGSTTAAATTQVVKRAQTQVTLESSYPTTTYRHAGSITATVVAVAPGQGGPSGTVVFKDRGVVIATVAVTMGRARISIASLSRGTHVITATYQGDSSFLASLTKTALTQKIT